MRAIRSRGGLAALLVIGGCAATPTPPPARALPATAPAPQSRVPGSVLGQNARELQNAFGAPTSILAEGAGRRLQFAGAGCVLDAYLYPAGNGEPAVTHIDTRRPTGEDTDRAACLASLRVR